ncbi:hypothetical protein P154DRAFT_476766 [Amniculicola lignicola CBS 123094]|uniref:Rhodopsin domain-containing protein n=1 Tax=Amniculicola lignicola CBS 123094 TaxID=1392246 RepID=A0A6A5VX19_9PLEO|nr:hypothetical protein P154DRAFT_476766 [Amniculicola lignicola CBS 123094]
MDVTKIDPLLLSKIPAVQPPHGTVSNFEDPESLDRLAMLTVYICLPVTVVPLLMRLYTRGCITHSWGADDYLIIASMISVVAFCALFLIIVKGPLGEHTWDVPISRLTPPYSKSNMASQCLYAVASLFVKVTLLIFYLRLFSPVPQTRVMIWIGVVLTIVVYIGTATSAVILYTPRGGGEAGWMAPKPENIQSALLTVPAVQGLIGVVIDFYILCIPVHLVLGLHLPLGRKIGVVGIFCTGFIGCICAIIGTVFRFKAKPSHDPLYMTVPAYVTGIIELCAGIICACLPVLLLLIKRLAKTNTYNSIVRYFRTRGTGVSQETQKDDMPREEPVFNRLGLKVPKPVLTGLKSFVKRHGKSRNDTMPLTERSYGQLDSVNDDYHVQLKNIQSR